MAGCVTLFSKLVKIVTKPLEILLARYGNIKPFQRLPCEVFESTAHFLHSLFTSSSFGSLRESGKSVVLRGF
jgi:hypothetical protein